MVRALRLRRWQKAALDQFEASPAPDFLAVATPGSGKTTFALTAAVRDLRRQGRGRVVVVAPTQHLKTQWARAARVLGLHLDPAWTPRRGHLPADMHGVVVTYQQVAGDPASLRPLTRDAFVVLDELHHAGHERAWGEAVHHAFEPARRRLSLSGTPFRSDTSAIPFVRYADDEAVADFEYGYGDALRDGGVVRPVFFPRLNGHMEWTATDGTHRAATFHDRLDRTGAGQRLRTALSVHGEWLPAVLRRAHDHLRRLRHDQPDAGGLVIAMDQEHARGVAGLLTRVTGRRPPVAVSDDPQASRRIAEFRDSDAPWLVAVRMVSEGVDLPRLRVGVYATNTVTELFFRQAVGRLVRWTPGAGDQPAYLYLPDDLRLRAFATGITEQRRHSLRRDTAAGEDADPEAADPPAPDGGDQLSLFAAISATPVDEGPAEAGAPAAAAPSDQGDRGHEIELLPPPPAGGGADAPAASTLTRHEHKQALREQGSGYAREIARRSGWSYARVNAELNRLTGVRRVSEATLEQLHTRRRHAERWLDRL